MSTSEFTEFSFGYALTDSLVEALGSPTKAPVFPSLIQEGKFGGGYDIELPAVPVPLFLQFKIQQVMVKASSLMPPGYAPIYYRMPIRTKAPNQHRLLMVLEAAKPHALVLYATPLFHKIADLDNHYLAKTVHAHTAFIPPSAIGSLNSKPHHVSYRPSAKKYWRHSEPVPIEGDFTFDALVDRIAKATAMAGSNYPGAAKLQSVDERLPIQRAAVRSAVELLRSCLYAAEAKTYVDEVLLDISEEPRVMATRLAYVAQVHFGVTMAWLEGAKTDSEDEVQS